MLIGQQSLFSHHAVYLARDGNHLGRGAASRQDARGAWKNIGDNIRALIIIKRCHLSAWMSRAFFHERDIKRQRACPSGT